MSPIEYMCECYLKEKDGYPKTFEECCNILYLDPESELICSLRYVELASFCKLLICRDAYWKKDNYKPKFEGEIYYYIHLRSDLKPILGFSESRVMSYFVFPKVSARDAFYENFKDLIEECKELI